MDQKYSLLLSNKYEIFWQTLIVICFSLILQVVLFGQIVRHFFPGGDEYSLIVNSTAFDPQMSWLKWFQSGFSTYFIVYPEWSEPYTNFLRPMVNLTYFVNYALFNSTWGSYLYSNFLFHSICVGFVFYLTKHFLKQKTVFAFLGALAMFLNPAANFISPAVAFDMLATVFVCMAFIALANRKVWFSVLALLLALYTKETAIYGSFAAMVMSFWLGAKDENLLGKLKTASLFLLPVVLWYSSRVYFLGNLSGVYAISDFGSPKTIPMAVLVAVVMTSFKFPLGFVRHGDVLKNLQMFIDGNIADLNFLQIALMILNLLFFLVFITYCTRTFFSLASVSRREDRLSQIFPWLFGISFILLILNLDIRIAYSFYLFGIPTIIYQMGNSKTELIKRFILFGLICFSLSGGFVIFDIVKQGSVESFIENNLLSRQLIDEIHEAGNEGLKVYILNDVSSGFSSAESIRKFSKSDQEVIKINGIHHFCEKTEINNGHVLISRSDDGYCVNIMLPLCADFVFEGISMKIFNHIPRLPFQRNADVTYEFPTEKIVGFSKVRNFPIFDYGKELLVKVKDSSKVAFVYYSFEKKKYERINCWEVVDN